MTAGKPIILCVDDNTANLILLDAILAPRGYEIIKAQNGREALDLVGKAQIDIVLLDVMMPGIDGFEVCRSIKKAEKTRNIPVIMITSLSSTEDRIRGIEAGAEDFISKPFDQGEIFARISMLLKMKSLNDRLISAYSNMIELNAHGEQLIRGFNQMDFNLKNQIDRIVKLIIRQDSAMPDKPQVVLVRILDTKGGYEWFRYESVNNRVERSTVALDVSLDLPDDKRSRTMSCNRFVVEHHFKTFSGSLRDFNIDVKNLVCYLSNALCIFAINYGRDVSRYDAAVVNSLVAHMLFMRSLAAELQEIDDAFTYTVYSLARAAEANDEDTGNHILRVGLYCAVLAKKLGMDDGFIDRIRVQATLHDVGKIHMPKEILIKPGSLTAEEFAIVKKHTLAGVNIIGGHPRLRMAKSIALTHHERWDGSGYPNGLKGEDIPFEGRLVNIADQYDALRNPRVYKPAFDHKRVCEIITEGDGRTMSKHFDPEILRVFKETAADFEAVYEDLEG
jgi:response regulator RpfG family c-di-GMP phosphodiesterase